MTAAILAGLVAGYGVAIQVGAMSVLLVGFSARSRLAVAASAGLGIGTLDAAEVFEPGNAFRDFVGFHDAH